MSQPEREKVGWILYDGSCGFCSKWVPFFESTLSKQDLGFAPLQAEWVRARLDLPEEELLADLRLLLEAGEVISGSDVYRFVMRRSWTMWPLYFISILPGFAHLFDWSYRTFANHRYQVSEACRLPAEVSSKEDAG